MGREEETDERDGEMSKTSFKAFCVEFYADHVGKTGPEVYAEEALDRFYKSATAQNLADEENGLYGQSALFIFGQYLEELALSGKNGVSKGMGK